MQTYLNRSSIGGDECRKGDAKSSCYTKKGTILRSASCRNEIGTSEIGSKFFVRMDKCSVVISYNPW